MKCKNKHCVLDSGHPGRCSLVPRSSPSSTVGQAAPPATSSTETLVAIERPALMVPPASQTHPKRTTRSSTSAPRPNINPKPGGITPAACDRCNGIPDRDLARLRRLLERRAQKQQAKPWVAAGISRAEWYRRRKKSVSP